MSSTNEPAKLSTFYALAMQNLAISKANATFNNLSAQASMCSTNHNNYKLEMANKKYAAAAKRNNTLHQSNDNNSSNNDENQQQSSPKLLTFTSLEEKQQQQQTENTNSNNVLKLKNNNILKDRSKSSSTPVLSQNLKLSDRELESSENELKK